MPTSSIFLTSEGRASAISWATMPPSENPSRSTWGRLSASRNAVPQPGAGAPDEVLGGARFVGEQLHLPIGPYPLGPQEYVGLDAPGADRAHVRAVRECHQPGADPAVG
ncbi:MAG TPA: hypothetical protein VL853_09615 [Gemmatimonadales bacterium]|nr:hypothetical protein [Gemmatimonadales bacterium]